MSTSSRSVTTVSSDRSPAELFALVSAAVYLGAGVVGFLVTGFDDIAGVTDEKVLILAVNPLHNVVHLALGAAYLVGARIAGAARGVNAAIGVGLLAAFVLGVAGGGDLLNVTSVSEPDNWLHLAWGAASLAFGRAAAGRVLSSR